jgi:hypothetical protein
MKYLLTKMRTTFQCAVVTCGVAAYALYGLPPIANAQIPPPIPKILLLEPAQVVPKIDDAIKAHGKFGCNYNRGSRVLWISGWVRNLSSDPVILGPNPDTEGNPQSAAHIHIGRVGVNKPPVRNLTVTKNGDEYTIAGSFTLTPIEDRLLLSEQLNVQFHTETFRPNRNDKPIAELRGQILAEALPSLKASTLSPAEMAAAQKVVAESTASDSKWPKEFPDALFETYREASRYPTLPLTPSVNDITQDEPAPHTGTIKLHPEYLDKRHATDPDKDQKLRYLRIQRPLSVDDDNWVIKTDANGNRSRTDRQSFFDHPGVQPRPARPMHIRFCLDDGTAEPNEMAVRTADGLHINRVIQPPSKNNKSRRQLHPRDHYQRKARLVPTNEKLRSDAGGRPPRLYIKSKTRKSPAKIDQRTSDRLESPPVPDPNNSTGSPPSNGSESYDSDKLFATLPRVGGGGWGKTAFTIVDTPSAMFPEVDPFKNPPGTNLLPTVYENMRDRMNNEMINTLPSTPQHPYNLLDGEPVVARLGTHASPTDDLRLILDNMFETLTGRPVRGLWEDLHATRLEDVFDSSVGEGHEAVIQKHRIQLLHQAEWAIDILEGNVGSVQHGRDDNGKIIIRPSRIPSNRAYRGFALLHHSGHRRSSRVLPVYDEHGKIVAGNVDVHQIWYDGRIESDTMFYDFGWDDIPLNVKIDGKRPETRWYSPTDPELTLAHWNEFRRQRQQPPVDEPFAAESIVAGLTPNPPPMPRDVPWTVTFTVDILNRGEDDFSPTAVYFDYPEQVKLKPDPSPFANLKYETFPEVAWGRMNLDGTNTPIRFGPPHVAMDGTFFPLAEGTRTLLKVKMAPTQYQNVHYTWGWRKHAPRAQAVENIHKRIPPRGVEFVAHYQMLKLDQSFVDCRKTIPATQTDPVRPPQIPAPPPRFFRLRIDDHERLVFDGIARKPADIAAHPERHFHLWAERYLDEEMINQPRRIYTDGAGNTVEETEMQHEQRVRISLRQQFNRLAGAPFAHPPDSSPDDDDYDPRDGPIIKLGDFSPAKRMWRAFHSIEEALDAPTASGFKDCLYAVIDARHAFLDWKDRNHLPSGIRPDPESDMSLLYVNNTLYGEMTNGGMRFHKWVVRDKKQTETKLAKPARLKLTIWNGDYFVHGYANPDFGGLRGWENQFKSTLPVGGQGSLFTFGRFHWRFNASGGTIGIPPAVKQRFKQNSDKQTYYHSDGSPVLEDIVEPNTPPTQLSRTGEPHYDDEQPDGVRLGVHKGWFRFNFEPSTRLRFYQFDPLHHDVAIYSVH